MEASILAGAQHSGPLEAQWPASHTHNADGSSMAPGAGSADAAPERVFVSRVTRDDSREGGREAVQHAPSRITPCQRVSGCSHALRVRLLGRGSGLARPAAIRLAPCGEVERLACRARLVPSGDGGDLLCRQHPTDAHHVTRIVRPQERADTLPERHAIRGTSERFGQLVRRHGLRLCHDPSLRGGRSYGRCRQRVACRHARHVRVARIAGERVRTAGEGCGLRHGQSIRHASRHVKGSHRNAMQVVRVVSGDNTPPRGYASGHCEVCHELRLEPGRFLAF